MLVKLDTLEKKIEIKSTKKHVVVIGAGFGGLAVAMRMGAKGYKVTVVDKSKEQLDLITFKKALYLLKNNNPKEANKLLKKLINSKSKLSILAKEAMSK